MLSNVPASKSTVVRIVWTVEEWRLVASELKKRFPDWATHEFTMVEFEEAMEEVIGQERQRTFLDFDEVQPQLFDAFGDKTKPISKPAKSLVTQKKPVVEAKVTSNGSIYWTPGQWEEVVLELHRRNPDAFANRLVTIGNRHAEEAQKVLSSSLHRNFVQVVNFRQMALKTWDAMPPELRNPELQERVIVDFPSGPVMAPPARKADNESAMASAVQKAFNAPVKPVTVEKKRKKHVVWSADDWLLIAREMLRQDPFGNLLTSTFPRVDRDAIRSAQRKIFSHEKHRTLSGGVGINEHLVIAFATLKREIQGDQVRVLDNSMVDSHPVEEAAKHAEEAIAIEPAPAPVITETPEPKPEVKQAEVPKVAPKTDNPLPMTPEVQFFGKLLNAAVPLANVIIDEVVSRLGPSLIAGILPHLEKSLSGMVDRIVAEKMAQPVPQTVPTAFIAPVRVEPVQNAPEQPKRPSKAELMALLPQPADKPKKPKIAVLMAEGKRREQLCSAFSQYEFLFIDHGHGIKEAGQSCVLFLANNAYISASSRQQLKDHVQAEKLKYIEGGTSAMKRAIHIWQVTQK